MLLRKSSYILRTVRYAAGMTVVKALNRHGPLWSSIPVWIVDSDNIADSVPYGYAVWVCELE